MVSVDFKRWVLQGFAVDDSCTDPDQVHTALSALARISGVVEAQRVVCARVLARCSTDPVLDFAAGSRTGRGDASGTLARAGILDRAPEFGEALTAGEIGAAHIDRLGGALRRLEPDQRDRLLNEIDDLVSVAKRSDSDSFDRHLRQRERELQADDGQSRFERQQAAVRLKTWTDPDSGMHLWKLTVDPRTAVILDNRLRAVTETMFHTGITPPFAPTDPLERQQFLRAHAMITMLTDTSGVRLGRPQHIIVEDRRTPTGHDPVYDTGLPVQLPTTEIQAMVTGAVVHHVIIDNNHNVTAAGGMNLGRTRRLASQPQRRALRALYATCAVPGCPVRFDNCTIHHIRWWRPPHNGTTDLDNLIPVCARHHHQIHEHGWTATLHPDRRLEITRPGQPALHGQPNRLQQTLQRTQPTTAMTTNRGP